MFSLVGFPDLVTVITSDGRTIVVSSQYAIAWIVRDQMQN